MCNNKLNINTRNKMVLFHQKNMRIAYNHQHRSMVTCFGIF